MDLLELVPGRDYIKKVKKRTRIRLQNIFSIPDRDWGSSVHLSTYLKRFSSKISLLSMFCNR